VTSSWSFIRQHGRLLVEWKPLDIRVISGYHHEVDESCALVGYYAASSGNFLPTFRDIVLVSTS